jgi:hypothetical protein
VAFFGFLAFVAFVLTMHFIASMSDDSRIRDYIQNRGGKVLVCEYAPGGPGWWGERDSRIYFVRFVDKHGNEHEAYCKTSTFSGVYFSEDKITKLVVDKDPHPVALQALEMENKRLRAELRSLNQIE